MVATRRRNESGDEASEPAQDESKADENEGGERRSKRQRSSVDYAEPSDGVDGPREVLSEVEDEDGAEEREGGNLTVAAYRKRLVQKDKELYKDPPVLPALDVEELPRCEEKVTRDKKSHVFKFPDYPDFRPNLSPEEVLRNGAFGGTYFRTIDSAVLDRRISSSEALETTLPEEWIEGLDKGKMLTSSDYDQSVNKYGVKCGGSLGMWESSGWISNLDPYGWFQWYCRFFQGRRTTDDERQIGRATGYMGSSGRFRNQLLNKIIRANTTYDDEEISPTIRQNLMHWGYVVTDADLKAYKKRKGME